MFRNSLIVRGLRIWQCHCCGSDYSHGMGSNPGQGTSTCCRCSQNKVCSLVASHTLNNVVQLSPQSSPRTLSSRQKETPSPLSSHFPLPPCPNSWQPLICLLSLWICLIWIFCINGVMQHVTFWWPLCLLSLGQTLKTLCYVAASITVWHSFL